jgi:hypothetical protein
LEAAADVADVEIDVLFLAYREDDPQWLIDGYPSAHIEFTDLHSAPGDHRWSQQRYHHMAALRNELLSYVRDREPEIFFSLDSDILLHPLAIKSALGILREQPDLWAVGTKCFLSKRSERYTNAGYWTKKGHPGMWNRCLGSRPTRADVLIASSFMRYSAYNTDYRFHRQGEDLGWSTAIHEQQGKLWFDPTCISKHVMAPELLNVVDKRVGW